MAKKTQPTAKLPASLFILTLVFPYDRVVVGVFASASEALLAAWENPLRGSMEDMAESVGGDEVASAFYNGVVPRDDGETSKRPFGYEITEMCAGRVGRFARVAPYTEYDPKDVRPPGTIDINQDLDWS